MGWKMKLTNIKFISSKRLCAYVMIVHWICNVQLIYFVIVMFSSGFFLLICVFALLMFFCE